MQSFPEPNSQSEIAADMLSRLETAGRKVHHGLGLVAYTMACERALGAGAPSGDLGLLYDEICTHFPGDSDAWTRAGMLQLFGTEGASARPVEAVRRFSSALKFTPDHLLAHVGLARSLTTRGADGPIGAEARARTIALFEDATHRIRAQHLGPDESINPYTSLGDKEPAYTARAIAHELMHQKLFAGDSRGAVVIAQWLTAQRRDGAVVGVQLDVEKISDWLQGTTDLGAIRRFSLFLLISPMRREQSPNVQAAWESIKAALARIAPPSESQALHLQELADNLAQRRWLS